MKWGRKKSSMPSSSSRASFISHVIPVSWLSKFKNMGIGSETKPRRPNQKGKQDSSSVCSKTGGNYGGRFYDGDDAFWRLSFGEEETTTRHEMVNRNVLKPLPNFEVNGSEKGRGEETQNLKVKVGALREAREEEEIETLRRRFEMRTKRVMLEKALEMGRELPNEAEELKSTKSMGDVLEIESPRTILTPRKHLLASSINSRSSTLGKIEEDCLSADQSLENSGPEWKKLKEKKLEELKCKSEKQRKSMYITRELQRRKPRQRNKVRVYSPRTPTKIETFKIRALEDMRKSKLKMRMEKGRALEEIEGLDSFAVVKCSFNPQKDFRDSMLEMITEKHISQPEEMEDLLTCYLTLNSDEYHDLIIKEFRQVWFDLKQNGINMELSKEC